MFSMACVFLEVVIIHDRGTLQYIRQNRSQDPSFQGNLQQVDTWCTTLKGSRSIEHGLPQEVKAMLVHDPAMRPTAKQLLTRITGYELSQADPSKRLIFCKCCQSLLVSQQQHEHVMQGYKRTIEGLQADVRDHKERIQETMRTMIGEHQQELKYAEYTHKQMLEALSNKHEHEVRSVISEMKSEFALQRAQLREEGYEEQRRIQKRAFRFEDSLKKDIHSRNKALVSRETFAGVTDTDLKNMFTELAYQIDALARMRWSFNRSAWTDELQSHMSDAPKRLRKLILRDTIWNLLFENLFYSPFRMLGDEGERLETQWAKDFGASGCNQLGWRYDMLTQTTQVRPQEMTDMFGRSRATTPSDGGTRHCDSARKRWRSPYPIMIHDKSFEKVISNHLRVCVKRYCKRSAMSRVLTLRPSDPCRALPSRRSRHGRLSARKGADCTSIDVDRRLLLKLLGYTRMETDSWNLRCGQS